MIKVAHFSVVAPHHARVMRAVLYNKQQGAVLIVGLIMVLLMTIVGLAAIRGSGMQENMASNMRDMNISFQAAESGLKVCEALVDINQNLNLPEFTNNNGLFVDRNASPASSVLTWAKADWDANARASGLNLQFVAEPPRCVVESLSYPPGAFATGGGQDLGALQTTGDPQMFRVSAIGYGYSIDSRMILQSNFMREFQ